MESIDKNQATQIAQQYLQNLDSQAAATGLVILDEYTLEKPYGWVFFYNTRAFAATHDMAQSLAGNTPFLVAREGGDVHLLGSEHPLEYYLAAYGKQELLSTPTPAPALPLHATDLVVTTVAEGQAAPVNSPMPLKRSQQGIIAAITAALLVITGGFLFTIYHQATTTAASIDATVTAVALVSQANQTVAANATAQTIAAHTPYQVAAPGSCDTTGKATWDTINDTVTSCVKGGLQMVPTSLQNIGEVDFYWNSRFNFPKNNSVEVTVQPVNDCGGILLRQPEYTSSGGYAFFLCSDNGYWDILRYDANSGVPTVLIDGYVAPQPTYDVKATAQDATETLSINGKTVASINDTTFLSTDHIALAVGETGKNGPVTFSNFTFTPLP